MALSSFEATEKAKLLLSDVPIPLAFKKNIFLSGLGFSVGALKLNENCFMHFELSDNGHEGSIFIWRDFP